MIIQRNRQQGRKQGRTFWKVIAMLCQPSFQLVELLLGGILPFEPEHQPLEKINDWVESTVLVIGEALAGCQPCNRFLRYQLLQPVYQARFPNASLSAQECNLAFPGL